ncbi:MAG: VOC family protein [Thermoanaerobaculia bacterium]|nr:VOC family protein [Thermoanaerobaculia bacterium]
MHLEHVNLTVADLDRSVDFYTRLLGFRVRWSGTTTEGKPAAHVGDDSSYLALFEGEAKPVVWDYESVGFNHFGVVVDSLDEAKRRLDELGAPIHFEPDYEPGRRAYFTDPDGYEVELVEYPDA